MSSWRVAMQCDVSRLTSRYDRRPDKNVNFPWFSDCFIVTPECHNASQIKSEQSRRRDYVAIASRLRHNVSRRNWRPMLEWHTSTLFVEHKHCSGFLSELYLCNSGINCLFAQHEQVQQDNPSSLLQGIFFGLWKNIQIRKSYQKYTI